MFYVDIPKLLGKMAEAGYNKASFAFALGINRNTLRTYLINYSKIPYSVIADMVRLLNCTAEEACSIFFATRLS